MKKKHNQFQRSYFDQSSKATMMPGHTPYIRKQVHNLIQFAELPHSSSILEVGCGMGRHTFLIAERGYSIEGLDLSSYLLSQLEKFDNGRFNIPVHCVDIAANLPELEGRFDAVIGFFVLHHLFDLQESFSAICRFLKPGGIAVFMEPNPYNPLYYLQITFTPKMSWRAEKNFLLMRRTPVYSAMQKAGFHELENARCGFFPRFLANHALGQKLEPALEQAKILNPILPFQMFKGIKIA